jgi:putative ATP-binding cassette transporter
MEQDEHGASKRRYLARRFWRSALGFWSRHGDRAAWLLTLALLVILVGQLAIQYELTVWNRTVFDALEKRDGHAVLVQALVFPALAAVSVMSWMLVVYARLTMERHWRAWMNAHVVDRWLDNGHYYQLNLVQGEGHKNPEYRIADDLRIATESPVEFATGIASAVLSAITFVVVLWSIGGALSFDLAGTSITVPGFLVVAAVLYAFIASGSMVVIGRRLVRASEGKNQAEAEYRYALTRLRENGESIALLGGEQEERTGLDNSLRAVLRRWREICFQQMRTTIVYQGSNIIAPVLPVILCAPKFLDGSMTLGQVMQAASAFVIVQQAFGWLVENYPRFADWTASAHRVGSLLISLDHLERAETEKGSAGSIATPRPDRRSRCAISRSRSTTAPPWSTKPKSPSRRASGCWWSASPGPGRAPWCAPSPACGPGAKATCWCSPARGCSCCRSGPMCRSEACAAPRPIRLRPTR